jgi:hypothetical protein
MADANLKEVMAFFEMPTSEFSKQWKLLSDADKVQLKKGIGDGSLDYT